jgi:hypothetical protein
LVGAFELQHDIAGAGADEPFVDLGGAGDRAAQGFEFLALMGRAAHFGMQAKALLVDTAVWRGQRLLAGDGLQAQYFLARPGPERNAVGASPPLAGAPARPPDRHRPGRSSPALR